MQKKNNKKNNLIVLISFLILIAICVTIIVVRKVNSNKQAANNTTAPQTTASTTEKPTEATTAQTTDAAKEDKAPIQTGAQDALFIGDSRTVGIAEYASLDGSDFFCDVGMSAYNINKKTISVPNVGKVTLEQLLDNKQYKKIYVMLGINEVGYNMNTTEKKFRELVDYILEKQPNAKVIIEANLHVTKARSDADEVVNNAAIDKLNAKLKSIADGKRIFYIDSNTIFDDGHGNLAADKTGDNAHLYAKYYKEWGAWIVKETQNL